MSDTIRVGRRVRMTESVTVSHFDDAPDVTFSKGEVLHVRECLTNRRVRGDGCVVVVRADGLARRIPTRFVEVIA